MKNLANGKSHDKTGTMIMSEDDEQHNVAHHGPPILTERDLHYCMAMVKWIRTARKFGGSWYDSSWLPDEPDIRKSRLFWRLRSGKQPLPHPPPTAYSCPWYELIEEDRPHWAYEVSVYNEKAHVAQCSYDIIETNDNGNPIRIAFGPWEFTCTYGESPYKNGVEGWWIQLINEENSSG